MLIDEVNAELQRARSLHAAQKSLHEGYAVLLEEVDEVWDEIKQRHPDLPALRKELIQVAAMAMRTIVDVIDRVN